METWICCYSETLDIQFSVGFHCGLQDVNTSSIDEKMNLHNDSTEGQHRVKISSLCEGKENTTFRGCELLINVW